MTSQKILIEFEHMPPQIQQKVMDFAAFLIKKQKPLSNKEELEQKRIAYASSFQRTKEDVELQELNEEGFEDYLKMIDEYEAK